VKNILWLFSIVLLFVSAAIAQTLSVPADLVAMLRKQALMTYVHTQIPHTEEYVAAVLSSGSLVYTMVIDRSGKLNLPQGIMLLLHTYPYGAEREPSDADRASAKKISAPNVW
jgi:hydrogenase/urease accessory protein HupE